MERAQKLLASLKEAGSALWHYLREAPRAQQVLLGVLAVLITILSIYLDDGPNLAKKGVAAAEAAGKKLMVRNFAVTGFWMAAVFNLCLCILLLPFSRRLTSSLSAKFEARSQELSRLSRTAIALSVLLAMVLVTAFGIPRLNHSLWHDEELSMRRTIVDNQHRRDEDGGTTLFGEITSRPVRWSETLWWYEQPNNHVLFSLCARLSHSLLPPDQSPDNVQVLYFNETALRLPSFFAALAALAALALMLVALGAPRAAIAAPLLLAFHPWFLRYASAARGYGFTFFFAPLCIFFLWRGLADGRWRWWIGYGLAQFLLLYSNSSAIYFLLLLNASAPFIAWTRTETKRSDRLVLLARWFLGSTLGAMLFLQMMAPNLLQFSHYFRPKENPGEIMGIRLVHDMLSSLASGMRWHNWHAENPFCYTLAARLHEQPLLTGAFLLLLIFFGVLGAAALWRRGTATRFLLPPILLAAPLLYAVSFLKGVLLYYWYIVFVLPLLWAIVALGIGSFARWLPGGDREGRAIAWTAITTAVFCLLLVGAGAPQLRAQIEHPIERARESVTSTRPVLNPAAPGFDDVLTIGFWKYTYAYDPGLYRVRSVEDIVTIAQLADREGKPLYVNYAMPGLARVFLGEMMSLIEDETKFEPAEIFWGLEPTTTRFVHRYVPGSLSERSSEQ
ncbi:MAG: hypothetical protein ACC661_05485 [Verrucomicrobiales bacterium]